MLDNMDSGQWLNALDASPVGIIATQNQTIVWCNAALRQLLGAQCNSLLNQPITSIDGELARLFGDEASIHLPASADKQEVWLTRSSHAVNDDDQTVLHYFADMNTYQLLLRERNQLREDLAEVMAIDEITGMPNHRALFQSLDSQVSRSRRYGNPLSVFILQVQNLEPLTEQQINLLMISISRMLNDQIRWADIVGRLNQTDFLIVLPETHEDACQHIANNMADRIQHLATPEGLPTGYILQVQCGYAEWQKGNDVGLLMMRAREALTPA